VNIGLKQTLYTSNMVCVTCSFAVYGHNEADVTEMLQSGEYGRIRNAMTSVQGTVFKCPFRLTYKLQIDKDGCPLWVLSKHESRHIHNLDFKL